MRNLYPEYTVNYISGCMSLRTPQKRSLKILDTILDEIELSKNLDMEKALNTVHDLYPTCTNFDRDFMSLTFALATGVGKTRLMGAFITYLYTQKGIKNFFVVAPNLTIYKKLIKDLGDFASEKYVFRGIGCFSAVPPNLITGENYAEKGKMGGVSDCTINIFNIGKFNSEIGNIHKLSEYLGHSYFEYLASKEDLVILMDESHHYRAEKGMAAINELKPVLGLELTATPQVEVNGKAVKFKNVVYEYPLSAAIADGYTKIPYAMTRRDINDYNLTKDELDRMMLSDGILNHERVKERLKEYAQNNQVKTVKPFALVVCQNTDHAKAVYNYITSKDFYDGKYNGKTIIVHSKQKGSEKEENVQQLLEVEKNDNPIEIVIHVNMLKEGWDVNNLFTIIPLRTAASQTLREQTIGRGLRLPYSQRTGIQDVDSLIITAHDKFEEIIREAASPDSLLKQGNIIFADDIEKTESITVAPNYENAIQTSMEEFGAYINAEGFDSNEAQALYTAVKTASKTLIDTYRVSGFQGVSEADIHKITEEAVQSVDLAEIVKRRTDFSDIIRRFTDSEISKHREFIATGTMAIPEISVSRDLNTNYHFEEFELDFNEFNYYPIDNDILLQNLVDNRDAKILSGNKLDYDALNPMKVLVDEICAKPEVDYDECSDLLYNLLESLFKHFAKKFNTNEIKNIVMFNKKDIAKKIYEQMKEHFVCSTPDIVEMVSGVNYKIYAPSYIKNTSQEPESIYNEPATDGDVKKTLYTGFKKALHPIYKFDSNPERKFAIVCENDCDVEKWLRPAPKQFNLYYGRLNSRYEPDFVVETADTMYLVEVKAAKEMSDEDNLAKKDRAVKYCNIATVYCEGHGLKPWIYLYIPDKEIKTHSSFKNLATKFKVEG